MIFMRFWRGFGGFRGGETLPKLSPNPAKFKILKNMQFGIAFCLIFWFVLSLISWKYAFRLDGSEVFKVFAKVVFLQFSCMFGPKHQPKILPKRGPNPSKIHAKNESFFNVDFWGLRPRFWWVLDAKMAPQINKTCTKKTEIQTNGHKTTEIRKHRYEQRYETVPHGKLTRKRYTKNTYTKNMKYKKLAYTKNCVTEKRSIRKKEWHQKLVRKNIW